MKKLIAFFLALTCTPLVFGAGNGKETDRVKDAGTLSIAARKEELLPPPLKEP